jgi:hypothetical protein
LGNEVGELLVFAIRQRFSAFTAVLLGAHFVRGLATGQSIRGERVFLRRLVTWEKKDVGFGFQAHVSPHEK